MPVHVGVRWSSIHEARGCPRGDIALAYCSRCGFIQNVDFNPDGVDYTMRYDNALHFSPFFCDYERTLAEHLVDRYHLRGKHIVEIGCGNGHFLALLCRLGAGSGTGFDPSHDSASADPAVGDQVSVVRDFYSERYSNEGGELVCCRHVLEHMPEPRRFLDMVRRALGDQSTAVLYFEVPNACSVFRDLSVWDIIYEHYGYFAADCLEYLFRCSGFDILDLRVTYAGQFLGIEATPSRAPVRTPPDEPVGRPQLEREVAAFSHYLRDVGNQWRRRLAHFRDRGSRVVVWGGGSKTVSFMNLLEVHDEVSEIVEINPGKQGGYLAGSGHHVVAPECLKEHRPDVVIVMNAVYRPEIEHWLSEMGLSAAEVLTV